jgi:hypothetical protein
LGTPLEATGRTVSIVFFYLCFFPLSSILRWLRFRSIQIVSVLAIFALGPLYIFYSRSFMMESTALFLSLIYADQMFRLTVAGKSWQYRHMIGAAVLGVLAGMVKVTTFAPFLVLGAALAAWQLRKLHRSEEEQWFRIGAAAFLTGLLPFAMTSVWTRFADSVKAQNPLGVSLTSKALESFTLGSIGQRLQPRWYHLMESRLHLQVGYTVAAALIVGVFAGILIAGGHERRFRRWTMVAVACAALWAGTTMLFFNLHAVHDYYGYATAVFLVVGIGALLAPLFELPGRKAWLGVTLLAVELAACAASYMREYHPLQAHNSPGRPDTAALIDQTTSAQSVILITGLDWSPELPYQSQRRAIMEVYGADAVGVSDLRAVEQAIADEGPGGISAVVACSTRRNSDRLKTILQAVGMSNPTEMHGDDCDIYERAATR